MDSGCKGEMDVSARTPVLIVDDSDDDLLLFREAFDTIDPHVECDVARDGREAIKRLTALKEQQRLPRLVLMDMNMPILDGCSAVRTLREELGLKELAIVVFTSSDLPEDSRIAYESGANACVRKPDTYAAWVGVLRSLVSFFIR